jgi:hypothetical protein
MRRAAVVFPVHGSPTVRNSFGCLIITRFQPNASSLLTTALCRLVCAPLSNLAGYLRQLWLSPHLVMRRVD